MASPALRVFLDAGHGGLLRAEGGQLHYPTPGKRYRFLDPQGNPVEHVFHPGVEAGLILEGVINRAVASRLATLLLGMGVEVHDVAGERQLTEPPRDDGSDLEQDDTPLSRRVAYANRFDPSTSIYVSVHANAIGRASEGPSQSASGFSIFTSPGKTGSDKIATSVYTAMSREVGIRLRARPGDLSDGDVDHEAAFYVLRNTRCRALLGEVGFFTHLGDAKFMATPHGQLHIARGYRSGLAPFLATR